MKPDVDRLLEVAAVQLIGKIGPALPTSFEQSGAATMGAEVPPLHLVIGLMPQSLVESKNPLGFSGYNYHFWRRPAYFSPYPRIRHGQTCLSVWEHVEYVLRL